MGYLAPWLLVWWCRSFHRQEFYRQVGSLNSSNSAPKFAKELKIKFWLTPIRKKYETYFFSKKKKNRRSFQRSWNFLPHGEIFNEANLCFSLFPSESILPFCSTQKINTLSRVKIKTNTNFSSSSSLCFVQTVVCFWRPSVCVKLKSKNGAVINTRMWNCKGPSYHVNP